MSENIINLIDNLRLKENFKGTIICGKMEVLDKFGNTILEKDNLVVLQGRAFVLKKLFYHPDIDLLTTKSVVGPGNADFTITTKTIPVLFTVGNGGTNGIESPTTFVPKYSDTYINSLFETGTDILSDGITKGKKFANVKYVNDTTNNESYIVLDLALNGSDFGNRSVAINEAGLLFGDATVSSKKITAVSKLKLLSRLTFDSIPINPGDEFTIRYYLYA